MTKIVLPFSTDKKWQKFSAQMTLSVRGTPAGWIDADERFKN
jgi:hypothetical protein